MALKHRLHRNLTRRSALQEISAYLEKDLPTIVRVRRQAKQAITVYPNPKRDIIEINAHGQSKNIGHAHPLRAVNDQEYHAIKAKLSAWLHPRSWHN